MTGRLSESDSALAAEAREFAASAMARVRSKFRRLADEIESEFNYEICLNLHRWDRRRSLYLWSIFRLRRSVSVVLQRQPGGRRYRGMAPLSAADLARVHRRPESAVLADATGSLPARTAEIVRLASEGHASPEIAGMLDVHRSNVARHLARARPVLIEALTG